MADDREAQRILKAQVARYRKRVRLAAFRHYITALSNGSLPPPYAQSREDAIATLQLAILHEDEEQP